MHEIFTDILAVGMMEQVGKSKGAGVRPEYLRRTTDP